MLVINSGQSIPLLVFTAMDEKANVIFMENVVSLVYLHMLYLADLLEMQ